MKIIDADDRSYDELYIDGHYIHPDNWIYDSRCNKEDRSSLQFLQHPSKQQRISLGGRLVFEEGHKSGQGVMYFADTRTGVILEELSVDQSKVLVGTYDLTKKGKKVGVLTIHPKGMVINGKKPKNIKIAGNKASWKENSGGGIFREGSIEFSDDGSNIIESSFNGSGRLAQTFGASRPRTAHGASSVILHVQGLTSMSPFNIKGDDNVQKDAMDDFYKLVQYFMPADYLHNFISSTRPQLDGYLRLIATDDITPGENAKYYESLAVPYLTYALSSADKSHHPDVVHLNYIRSDHRMKTTMHNSPVYIRHSGKMYRYHWRQKFPRIDDYLRDQEKTDYTSTINAKTQKWMQDATNNLSAALDQADINNINHYISEIGRRAVSQKQYWAFAMIQDQASTVNLTSMKTQILFTPKKTDDIIREHEKNSSVLSILDPTTYFTEQFALIMQLFQLTFLFPQSFDPSSMDDLNLLVRKIAEGFVTKYTSSPDPELAEAAHVIQEKMINRGWSNVLPHLTSAAQRSTNWSEYHHNLQGAFKNDFGSVIGNKMGNIMAANAMSAFNATSGSGLVHIGWHDMTAFERSDFIFKAIKGAAFVKKKLFPVMMTLAPGWWEGCKVIYFKTKDAILHAGEKISGAIAKWIVKNAPTSKFVQGLVAMRVVAGPLVEKAFKKLKIFGRKLNKFLSARFGGIMAIAGIIFNSIRISKSTSSIEIAMNSLSTAASVLDIVSFSIDWVITGVTAETVTIAGTTVGIGALSTVSSIASGLSIAASIVGFIIMIVMFFQTKDPPDPVIKFCNSQEVKNAGLYMLHGATVEYFKVQVDGNHETKQIGITMTTDGSNYMHVNVDGTITFSAIDHSYSTVFVINSDDVGNASLFTKQISHDHDQVLHLTVNDDDTVKMIAKYSNKNDQPKQFWDISCTGNTVYINNHQLESATFTIYNKHKRVYLRKDGTNISVGANPQEWTIKLEYMKPDHLKMNNIVINTVQRGTVHHNYLGQPGSTSGRRFTIRPNLPDWLEFDNKIGTVSQKGHVAPPVTSPVTYTLDVQNAYGKDTTTFTIEVIN
jgi:hypothetical protein